MELWIRSQDRESLIKTNIVELECFGENCFVSINTRFDGKNGSLGLYKTKERALEVLDEIQNILQPKYILDSSSIKPDGDSWAENGMILQKYNANARVEELSTYVYEMPKE